jgi:aerobic-type carbon monoxide dehydrogenase small subunit (CoxS/CutS family)
MAETFDLEINGARRQVESDPERSLLSVLRDDLGLTGVKYGCGEGQCGACTVLLDGKAIRSCITRVGGGAGKAITTVEGLAKGEKLHPVQEAFLAEGAMQCGYCVPGMILSACSLLSRTPRPTDEEIVLGMEGNICRCCAYGRMHAAVRRAALGGRR